MVKMYSVEYVEMIEWIARKLLEEEKERHFLQKVWEKIHKDHERSVFLLGSRVDELSIEHSKLPGKTFLKFIRRDGDSSAVESATREVISRMRELLEEFDEKLKDLMPVVG